MIFDAISEEILDLEEVPAVNQVEWHPFHHDDQLCLAGVCRSMLGAIVVMLR